MRLGLLTHLAFSSITVASPLYESAPINYYEQELVDEVAEYFANGAGSWHSQGPSGYLTDFLETFVIPRESQVLVYSNTSFQICRIRPDSPRAILSYPW